jgi:hypothetical protein
MNALLAAVLLVLVAAPAASAQLPPHTVVAGTAAEVEGGNRGDGGPATAAAFDGIDGLDHVGDGSILVADGDDGRVRRIAPDGIVHTNSDAAGLQQPVAVVGTGWMPSAPWAPHSFVAAGIAGVGRVSSWSLDTNTYTLQDSTITDDLLATDIDVMSDGSGFWVVDRFNGVLSARFNDFLMKWDVAPAFEGEDEFMGVGTLPGGGFLAVTGDDCRVWRKLPDRAAEPVAGNGFCASGPAAASAGDGGPATAALLWHPEDVEATPDGGFVVRETDRIRRVAPDGTISTYFALMAQNEQPPPHPTAIEVTPDGDLLLGLERRILRFDTNYAPSQPPPPPPGGNPNPNPQPPPPGDTPKAKLSAALAKSAYKVTRGKRLKLKVTASAAGSYRLDVLRKGKRVKRKSGKVKAGANTIAFKAKLKPGRYKLKLSLSAGGGTATDTATLTIRR